MSSPLSHSIPSTLHPLTHIHWISLWRIPRFLSLTPGKELKLVGIQILQLWQWHNITVSPVFHSQCHQPSFLKAFSSLSCLPASPRLLLFLRCMHTILKIFSSIIQSSRGKKGQTDFYNVFELLILRGKCAPKTKMLTLRLFASPHLPKLNLEVKEIVSWVGLFFLRNNTAERKRCVCMRVCVCVCRKRCIALPN